MGLLDTDIRNIVSSAADFLMLDATLRKFSAGTFDQATQKMTGKNATNYAVRGFVDEDLTRYSELHLVSEATAIGLILQVGAGATPRQGDHLVLRDTWRILRVQEDPAEATWLCQLVGAGDET